jgi:hypothetical protein
MSKLSDIISKASEITTHIDEDEWKKICLCISNFLPKELYEIIYVIIMDYYNKKSLDVPQKLISREKTKKDVFIITDNFDDELKKQIISFLQFIKDPVTSSNSGCSMEPNHN